MKNSKLKFKKAQAGFTTPGLQPAENLLNAPTWDPYLEQGPTPNVLTKQNATGATDVYNNQYFKPDPAQSNTPRFSGQVTQPERRYKMTGTGKFRENPLVAGATALALGVTGIANNINDIRLKNQEELQVMQSQQANYYEDMEAKGLNNIPAYMQAGGDIPDENGIYSDKGGTYSFRKAEGKKNVNRKKYVGNRLPGIDTGISVTADVTAQTLPLTPDPYQYNEITPGPYNSADTRGRSVYKNGKLVGYQDAEGNWVDGSKFGIVTPAMQAGGPSKSKAKEMLNDGTANGKKLTEKQRKYFGAIASGNNKKQAGGIAKTGAPAKPVTLDPLENYYQANAQFSYFKNVLNDKLKAKNPKAFADFYQGAAPLASNNEAREKYIQDSQYNDYLAPEEIQSTLGQDYDTYLNAARTINAYRKQQKQPVLYGGVEGDMDIADLNFGRRFSALRTTNSFSQGRTDANKQPIGSYERTYTYNPQTRLVDAAEVVKDKGIRPSQLVPLDQYKAWQEQQLQARQAPQQATAVTGDVAALPMRQAGGASRARPYQPWNTTAQNGQEDAVLNMMADNTSARVVSPSMNPYLAEVQAQNAPAVQVGAIPKPFVPTAAFAQNNQQASTFNNVFGNNPMMASPSATPFHPESMRRQAGGPSRQRIEAEEGEVYQNIDQEIMKIGDDAGTHEEGGVVIEGADRVLEDTSEKRKDKASKALKIPRDEFKQMFGFDPKRPVSHATAYEKAVDKYDKDRAKVERAQKDINAKPNLDKFSANSADLNFKFVEEIPTDQEVFDTSFAHQELVKGMNDIQDDGKMKKTGGKYKKQAGGATSLPASFIPPSPQPSPWPTSNQNKFANTTPAGNANAFNYPGGEAAYRQAWGNVIPNINDYQAVSDVQGVTYDFAEKNNPAIVDAMWQEGLTRQGLDMLNSSIVAPGFKETATRVFDEQGRLKPGTVLTPQDRANLRAAYVDGYAYNRTLDPTKLTPTAAPKADQPASPAAQLQRQRRELDPTATVNYSPTPQPGNRFNEPIYGDELLVPGMNLVDSMLRTPELYNPQTVNQLKFKMADPTAALNANEANYRAGLDALGDLNIGAGAAAANIANLAAQKYNVDQQVIGQYENQNANLKNQEIQYNTQVRDKQSALDANTRATYYNNVLVARDNQRVQRAKAIEDITRVIQMKRRQNASGNLVMKMSPAYNQQGEYNGYQYVPVLPGDVQDATGAVPAASRPNGRNYTNKTTVTQKVGDRVIKTENRQ